MSQTDLNVANAPGAAVRTDLNAHLDALVTQSSGSSAPSPTFPNQPWFDTSTNIMKVRDNANTAWVNVASKSGTTWIPYRSGTLLGDVSVLTAGVADGEVPVMDAVGYPVADGSQITNISAAALPPNYISGLRTSNDTDTAHDIAIAVGGCRDDGDAVNMSLTSIITKQIDAVWALGDDAGGLDTGTVASTTLYGVWLIRRSDTGVVDALFSTSFTSPTMPTNYNQKRLVGFVKTEGAANIIAFTQRDNYFRFTGDVLLDVNDSSITTTFETGTLSAPPFGLAHAYLDIGAVDSGTSVTGSGFVRSVGAADVSVRPEAAGHFNGTVDGGSDIGGGNTSGIIEVLVDGSSQVEYAGVATAIKISTFAVTMLTRNDP